MILSLIGMSGVGKSYWSTKLEQEADFKRICCDDLIGERLSQRLESQGIKTDLKSVATWRGLPFEARYRANERLQIENEQAVMTKICHQLEDSRDENIVVDTSGSVIYIDLEILHNLQTLSKIVCIRATAEQEQELYNDEVIFHRPLVWGNAYQPTEIESTDQAMRRCFGNLLAWRSQQYEHWAQVTLPYQRVRRDITTANEFLHQIS